MDVQSAITELRKLDLDPQVIEPLITRLQSEGLTDELRQEFIKLLETENDKNEMMIDTLEGVKANFEANADKIAEIDRKEQEGYAQIEKKLDDALKVSDTPPTTPITADVDFSSSVVANKNSEPLNDTRTSDSSSSVNLVPATSDEQGVDWMSLLTTPDTTAAAPATPAQDLTSAPVVVPDTVANQSQPTTPAQPQMPTGNQ